MKEKNDMKRKKKIGKLLICVATCIIVMTACVKTEHRVTEAGESTEAAVVTSQADTNDSEVLFTVDGYPVSREEFSLFIRNQRAATTQYFYTTYGIEGGEDFWVTEYGGQTPSEYCKELALEEIVAYKMERILAYERGLVEHVDYDDLMGDMEQLNAKNRKHSEGQISYGLATYEPWQYLLYIRSDCDARLLKDEIRRCEESVPEESLKARYEEEKEDYNKGYEITYERLDVFSTKDGSTIDEALAAVAASASEHEETLKDAAAALDLFEDYTAEEKISSEDMTGKDDLWGQWIQAEVQELEEGMISEPVVVSEDTGSLLRCIQKEALGYVSFEDAKPDMIRRFAEESLQEELEQRIEHATVQFVDDKYEQIIVE